MKPRPAYPSDVNDKEWQILEPLIPKVKEGGRPAEHSRREIINAIFYVLRSGCQWPMMPHDLPHWKTVYTHFRNWRRDGTWLHIHDALRKKVRKLEGHQPEASAAILDSQSVRTTEKGGHMGMMQVSK